MANEDNKYGHLFVEGGDNEEDSGISKFIEEHVIYALDKETEKDNTQRVDLRPVTGISINGDQIVAS
eukprot:CAMPEP_0116896998 /NCGR_PEP_ID=MMETSP0467-20121206/6107_1 /TAXON_ID=283647 /ORGANISM="Mesodinium pulex, Strain SPMC105" /LENGTH=66 /DNA_ID=CAMNT_0004568459 /DNA_START=561 /DNA_END=761 /DNA_ORIENTATION=-